MEDFTTPDITKATAQDQIADEAGINFDHVYASTGQRFLNFLIDFILVRLSLTYALGYAVFYLLAVVSPDYASEIVYGTSQVQLYIISYLIAIFSFIVYYASCEKLFKGITLGKLITGTKAVRQDGTELTFKDALLRTLSRIVPFEAFSAFNGHPWHDQWTDTMVIKTR